MPGGHSYYALLGLSPETFSEAVLRKQYHALAKRWHPDRNRGNEAVAAEKFKEVQEAFSTLSDPDARAAYDMELFRRRRQWHYAPAPPVPRGAARAPSPPPDPPPDPPPPPPPRREPPPDMNPVFYDLDAEEEDDEEGDEEDGHPVGAADNKRAAGGRRHPFGHPFGFRWRRGERSSQQQPPPPHSQSGGSHGTEDWPGLEAALERSERDAQDQAQLEAARAVEEVEAFAAGEAAEMEEALQLVAEAMQKEEEEMAEMLRQVALSESMQTALAPPPIPPHAQQQQQQRPPLQGGAAVEAQLAALMELGFHAALAAPYCDGVTPLEVIIDRLAGPDDGGGGGGGGGVVDSAGAVTMTGAAPSEAGGRSRGGPLGANVKAPPP